MVDVFGQYCMCSGVQCVFWGVEWFVVVMLFQCVLQGMLIQQCGDFCFQFWCILVWVVVDVEIYFEFVGNYIVGVSIGMDVGDLQVGWWEIFVVVILVLCVQFGQGGCCLVDWVVCFFWVCYMVLYVLYL